MNEDTVGLITLADACDTNPEVTSPIRQLRRAPHLGLKNAEPPWDRDHPHSPARGNPDAFQASAHHLSWLCFQADGRRDFSSSGRKPSRSSEAIRTEPPSAAAFRLVSLLDDRWGVPYEPLSAPKDASDRQCIG